MKKRHQILRHQTLVKELLADYTQRAPVLHARLEEFKRVPVERCFYELAFCLLTPQSNARHCFAAVEKLEAARFHETELDPEPFLAPSPDGYVRFHKTKAKRLVEMKMQYPDILAMLDSPRTDKELRDAVAAAVKGIGLKEASHFLRNIGRVHLTILDRHILRYLVKFDIIEAVPQTISARRYHELETAFETLADSIGIPAPEFDLLLWSRETGIVLK